MASNSKNRSSSKKLHILLLRVLILLSLTLLALTLALQVVNVLFPAEAPSKAPTELGNASNAFVLTKENAFPFLLAPLLLLIIGYLYLKKYLSRNSISAMDHIPYFRKHPHTIFGRKFCILFSILAIFASAVLAAVCYLHSAKTEALFGTVAVVGCSILFTFSTKTLRHTRRQYFSNRRKQAVAKDGLS